MVKKKAKKKKKVTSKKTVAKKTRKPVTAKRPSKVIKLRLVPMDTFGTLSKIAIWLGIAAGIFWVLFGLMGSLSESFATFDHLINGLIVGGLILITAYLAWKFKRVGAILFILEGIFVISMLFWRTVNPTSGIISGVVLLGGPLIVAGFLRLMDQY